MDAGFYDYDEGITALDALYERPRLNAIHVVVERGRAARGRLRDIPRLARGVAEIFLSEARRQGWTLPEKQVLEVFKLDIELNAQGLEAWLDSNSRGK
ncbi:MAG: hypothetical protein EPO20_25030 [Betaproteobacteria bacterium]|nr:MAG: hypothetical protein EPO20_25030 [Betaproteobacteria bacterium]